MTREVEGWNLTEEERKMLNHREKQEAIERIRYRQTRQGAFEASILSLDRSEPGQGLYRKCSDHGDGAEKIRAAAWGDEPPPMWCKLWDRAMRGSTRKQKRILRALLVDPRTTVAAKIAGVTERSVQLFKKTFFKRRFAQCLQAWKRDFQ